MLAAYIEASMRRARFEALFNGAGYYGSIPGLQGVWANAETLEACSLELQEVLEAWVQIGLERGYVLPAIDGIDLDRSARW